MKIVFAAGASGGHVFPAIYAARSLRKENHDIFFITTKGLAQKIIEENEFQSISIAMQAISFSTLSSVFQSACVMSKAFFLSLRILKDISPNIVVGFGGYASIPVVAAAWCCGKSIVIHEQNVIAGRANRLAGIFAKRICVSFRKTEKYFYSYKTVLTGCPCRAEDSEKTKDDALKEFKLQKQMFTILVIGGSQGSRSLNEVFARVATLLSSRLAFQFIHLCGESQYSFFRQSYRNIKTHFFLLPFLSNIESAYQAADLVIARAGAMTVFELMRFRKQSVLIPYPFAGAHQRENADILVQAGLASIIEEKDLSAESLSDEIQRKFSHKITEEDFLKRIKPFFIPDASKRLAQEILRAAL